MATALLETRIWQAIKTRVDTLLPQYKKAWPGEKFELPSGNDLLSPYIRIGRVSLAPARRYIADGRPHERTGSVIVTLVYPLGQAFSVYDQIASEIADHFVDGTQMTFQNTCVNVTSYPHIQDGYEDMGYWTVPVVVPWRCFA